jgi:hypothetical protein
MEIPIPTPKEDQVLYCTVLLGYSINYTPKMFARFGTLLEGEEHIKRKINKDLQAKATEDEMACLINEKNEPIVILELLDLKIENGKETESKTMEFFIFDPENNEFLSVGNIDRGQVVDKYNERIAAVNKKLEEKE